MFMHVLNTVFQGDCNVGMYIYATDDYVLAGREVNNEQFEALKEVFNVPVHRFSVSGTGLLGVFLAGNSSCLLVPSIINKEEVAFLKELNINFEILKSDITCLGNTIVATEISAIVSDEFEDEAIKQIEKSLKVNVKPGQILGLSTVGSLISHNNIHGLVPENISPEDQKLISFLKFEDVEAVTVNRGGFRIRSGVVANKNGFVIGELSTGSEIVNIESALGFSNN